MEQATKGWSRYGASHRRVEYVWSKPHNGGVGMEQATEGSIRYGASHRRVD